MPTPKNSGSNELQMLMIGVVVRAHGLRGAVKVRATTDEPQRFALLEKVQLQRGEHPLGEYLIERLQIGNQEIFVKLHGVDDRNQAESLRGASVMIRSEARLPTKTDQFYHFEIIGLPAYTAAGEAVGEIVGIETFPAHDVWVIRCNGQERLIPAVKPFIKEVDLQNRRVVITPIPGLLEDLE